MRSVIDFERTLLGILWLFWLVYWISAAQRAAPNKRMETLLEGASYRIPLAIGVFLTVFWWMPLFLRIPALWTQSPLAAGIGLAFTVAGLSFAVWARTHLGKYWSGRISLKENHRVFRPDLTLGSGIRFIVALFWPCLAPQLLSAPSRPSPALPSCLFHSCLSLRSKKLGSVPNSERNMRHIRTE